MDHPPWLDESFLATVLAEDKLTRVRIHKFSVLPAVAAGNNYMSKLFRINVLYSSVGEEEELMTSLIVKAPHTKGFVTEVKDQFDIYSVEPRMYRELLPRFKVKIKEEFGPKQFNCSVKDVLVFDDLTKQGYYMCDKFKQFDFAHCAFALKTLAKLHATSVVCHKEDPLLVKELGAEKVYKKNAFFEKDMKPWIAKVTTIVADVLSELEEDKASVEYLLSKISTIADSMVSFCKPKTVGLNVLNHGDFWMNNMMFKHNESGDIVSMKILDFQVPRYCSPAADLIYFLWSSANTEVRDERLHDLFDIYLQIFNDTLEQLGMEERLTHKELEKDLRAGEAMAVLTCCNFLPTIMSTPEDAINIEEVNIEDIQSEVLDDKYLKVYRGSHFKAILPDLIRHLRKWICTLE